VKAFYVASGSAGVEHVASKFRLHPERNVGPPDPPTHVKRAELDLAEPPMRRMGPIVLFLVLQSLGMSVALTEIENGWPKRAWFHVRRHAY
jgi:hypothetical protein